MNTKTKHDDPVKEVQSGPWECQTVGGVTKRKKSRKRDISGQFDRDHGVHPNEQKKKNLHSHAWAPITRKAGGNRNGNVEKKKKGGSA